MNLGTTIRFDSLRPIAWYCLAVLLIAGYASHTQETLTVHKVARFRPRVDETRPPGSEPSWQDTGKVVTVTTIPFRAPVFNLVYGESAVWVPGRELTKIDPVSNSVAARFKEASGCAVGVGQGEVWVMKMGLGSHDLLRIDPETGLEVARVSGLPHHRGGPAVGEGSVWIHVGGKVLRIDPKTAKVVATIPTHGSLGVIAFNKGAVWVLEQESLLRTSEQLLSRIDTSNNRLTQTIHLGSGGVVPIAVAVSIAVGEGAVWVTQSESGRRVDPLRWKLLRIDPNSSRIVRAIPLWTEPMGVVVAAGSVWVASAYGSVLRVDPQTNEVTERFQLPARSSEGGSLVSGAGALWAGTRPGGFSSGYVCRIDLKDLTTARNSAVSE
jgi:DNA-binding beta-propeller fold protein YncE